jgi:hypothetical protein
MTDASPRPPPLRGSAAPATVLPAVAACSDLRAPTEQSIAGLRLSGIVSVTDNLVTGGGRDWCLDYRGFAGRYTQSTDKTVALVP